MAAVKAEQLDAGSGCLQQSLQLDAGPVRHHRVLVAMAQQHRQRQGAGLPVGVGIAAASNDTRQRQGVARGPAAAGHIESHGRALGEPQQHGLLQRHRFGQSLQACVQGHPARGQLGPAALLQVVPLASHPSRVRQRRTQGHDAHLRAHQQLAQIEQIVGVGAPAVQQHQAVGGLVGAVAEGFPNGGVLHGHGAVCLRRLAG